SVEEALLHHAVVALRVLRPHGTLVAEGDEDAFPIDPRPSRQGPVDRSRRRTAAEAQAEDTALRLLRKDAPRDELARLFDEILRINHFSIHLISSSQPMTHDP